MNNFDLKDENYDDKDMNTIAEKYGYDINGTVIDSYRRYGNYPFTSSLASAILSPLIYPFFYLTNRDEVNANEILMEEFIEPVLEIANQENS